MKKRRRFKQTTSLQERIAEFTDRIKRQADATVDRHEKEALLKKAHAAETAAALDQQLSAH
jgi:predicted transcriptional regulator